MDRSSTKKIQFDKREWWALFIIIFVSSLIRLKINYSTEFIPGGNGAYYLVVVRNIFEPGNLVYRDFPLVFWLEAAIAFVPFKLGLMDLNAAIDFAVRTFDSVVPTLSMLPAYYISKKILGNEERIFPKIIIASVSVLYVSFFMLISEFQKNSLGLLWLFSLVYWILKVHEKNNIKNILMVALFFILTAVTHYGCIAVAITIIIADLIISTVIRFNWKKLYMALLIIAFLGMATILIVNLINHWRLISLIEAPQKIMRDPVISYLFIGEPVISPLDIITILLVNTVALASLFTYFTKFKLIETKLRSFILTMIVLSLFLASPFLGLETAQRLYFISYLTALPLLAFIHRETGTINKRKNILLIVSAVLLLSTIYSSVRNNYSNMNKTLYAEMTKMKKKLPQDEGTLIVARHGMEFWSNWIFRNYSVRQEELSPSYWRWYNKVYFLFQKKDKSPFGQAGTFGKPFPEPTIPENSNLIFSNKYFNLYLSKEVPKNFSIFIKGYK